MTWLAALRAILALANVIANFVREQSLMDAGEAKATARSLAALSARLGIAQQVADEVAALSDEELNRELRGD